MILATGFLILLSVCNLSGAADWWLRQGKYVDLSPTIPRIIGGEEAVPHEYPFQVGLLINGNSFCGGSLVSNNYVLTAAHCATVISTVEIILGAHNLTADEDTQLRLTASEIHVHEQYNRTDYQNDIAILRLSETVTLNDYIQTIKLPSRSEVNNTYENTVVTSTGWGLTADLDHPESLKDISPVLKYVNVAIQPLVNCGDYYNRNIYDIAYVTELNLCTSGYKNKGTCRGDSGGPLIHNGIQIGLVSIGTTLCELCSPSIFTNVAKHLDWIEANSDVVT
ncbi:brachyurin [Anoplophora glabripennis]|uniref:brachyurin n=1 Tax=Anoplophora glabripennis TaxID=217634 RepID=UPI000874B7D0|nr:brachyurin [Anoplophora glabripennis]